MTRARGPQVYQSISRIMEELARKGIPKARTNRQDGYDYRSIDDVLNALAPSLARHRICVLPRVLKRQSEQCVGLAGTSLVSVRVLVAYDIVSSRDASVHTVRSWGEALDPGDKGTAKALSSAYKGAMLQVFCIPVAGEDADATSHKVIIPASLPRPAQGWVAWSTDILDMIRVCESCEALDRVRTRYEALLHGLRRECPDLYAQVGNLFTARASQLATPSVPPGKAAKNILEEADD